MDKLLSSLRAAAEATRLRLMTLCADGELTVIELTQILGQSQPRVSRHLKLLCDARVLRRTRDQNEVYYRATIAEDRRALVQEALGFTDDDAPEAPEVMDSAHASPFPVKLVKASVMVLAPASLITRAASSKASTRPW